MKMLKTELIQEIEEKLIELKTKRESMLNEVKLIEQAISEQELCLFQANIHESNEIEFLEE